jgi:ElaB/YqjD/DUF883 family membrane-anchored ribosome-binding protein
MLTTRPNSVEQKRDLHVGGMGAGAVSTLAAVTDPMGDVAQSWLDGARRAVRDADDFVRDNPWRALAVVALIGVAAGFLLSRTSQSN